ncbi:hypothetical protein [Niabella aurantiaca]|uniref:hypothetical protein n=1 Tax=Niabella aurantiaca TaxID=379900 RepID=UPI00036A499E|nr:hypothetical protein [Niabella aurantiaca]
MRIPLKKIKSRLLCCCLLLSGSYPVIIAQDVQQYRDSAVMHTTTCRITLNKASGTISYRFANGTALLNTTALFKDKKKGTVSSSGFARHSVSLNAFGDKTGKGLRVIFKHEGGITGLTLTQELRIYKDRPGLLLTAALQSLNGAVLESNYSSPLAVLPETSGSVHIPGNMPRVLDVPFDNDNWVKILAAGWEPSHPPSGTSYEFISLYDQEQLSGFVMGAVDHDFWKTGIRYGASVSKGWLDSLVIFGGASTPDNSTLPAEYGGYDGTHDVVAHGAMKGMHIVAPLVFMDASLSRTMAFEHYAHANVQLNGALQWKHPAPFYWNSFGVEGVLGYEKRMMPADVPKIVDYLAALPNFSRQRSTVLSIDSYDQGIYTKDVLHSIGSYAAQHRQRLGFYFIPFAVWTWKSSVETGKLQYTETPIREVTLKDNSGRTIVYKNGDFGAFPLDPTHPATRLRIIGELQKAKAINAKFLKIDFLSAGALESTTRFDPKVHTGMQAYNRGMKMLKSLIDSILGPDIFITQAISPLFPYQYAHTRFLSTDIYSHFRDDLPGFPHYGSTASSMISASHLGWAQGVFWPYTNMDVVVMKNFQKNADIPEQDVRTRLISMITMGSILGDGTDFRDSIAAARGRTYLNNASLCRFFSHPRAFHPLKLPDGLSQDQQLSFYLPGDTLLLSTLNFSLSQDFNTVFSRKQMRLQNRNYNVTDFFTGRTIATWKKEQETFPVNTSARDAQLFQLIPIH